ncbi:hypothetical protein EV424DRAFT_1355216, partial [Suillus variegatus]
MTLSNRSVIAAGMGLISGALLYPPRPCSTRIYATCIVTTLLLLARHRHPDSDMLNFGSDWQPDSDSQHRHGPGQPRSLQESLPQPELDLVPAGGYHAQAHGPQLGYGDDLQAANSSNLNVHESSDNAELFNYGHGYHSLHLYDGYSNTPWQGYNDGSTSTNFGAHGDYLSAGSSSQLHMEPPLHTFPDGHNAVIVPHAGPVPHAGSVHDSTAPHTIHNLQLPPDAYTMASSSSRNEYYFARSHSDSNDPQPPSDPMPHVTQKLGRSVRPSSRALVIVAIFTSPEFIRDVKEDARTTMFKFLFQENLFPSTTENSAIAKRALDDTIARYSTTKGVNGVDLVLWKSGQDDDSGRWENYKRTESRLATPAVFDLLEHIITTCSTLVTFPSTKRTGNATSPMPSSLQQLHALGRGEKVWGPWSGAIVFESAENRAHYKTMKSRLPALSHDETLRVTLDPEQTTQIEHSVVAKITDSCEETESTHFCRASWRSHVNHIYDLKDLTNENIHQAMLQYQGLTGSLMIAHKGDELIEGTTRLNSPPQRPITPTGHAYGGMVGAHETERAMYPGGPTGMPDGRPMSVPALTPGPSSHEFQRPASRLNTAPGGVGTSTSSAQNTSGPPKSMKISQVLSEMTSFNRRLAHAEDLELRHANELRAVETRCVQQIEAAKMELKAQIKDMEEKFEAKLASLLASKSRDDVRDTAEAETDEEFEKDVEKLEKSAIAFGDNGLK